MKRNRLPQRAAPLTAGRSKAKRQLGLGLNFPSPRSWALSPFFKLEMIWLTTWSKLVGGLGFRNAFVSPDARRARPSSSQFTLTRVRRNTVVLHFGSRVG